MAFVGLAGVSLFLLASFVVGFRLVGLWSKTRQLPELMIGLSFLLAGGFGGVASIAGAELAASRPGVATPLLVFGTLLLHGGVACLTVFVGRVFRPGRGGQLVMWTLCIALAVAALATAADAFAGTRTWAAASVFLRIGIYGWATTESGMQWFAARRREALGLADPAVVNRYLLWTLGIGSVLLLWSHSAWQLFQAEPARGTSYVAIAVLGSMCAGSLWLAFFPSDWWLRHLSARRSVSNSA